MINIKYTYNTLDIELLNKLIQLCTTHKTKVEIFDICLLINSNNKKRLEMQQG